MLTNLEEIYELEKKHFVLCGIYPLKKDEKYFLYGLRPLILYFLSSWLFISMIIYLTLGVDDFSKVTDILYYLMTQAAYLWKLSNFTMNQNILCLIEENLSHKTIYKYYEIFGTKNLKFIIKICKLTATIFRISVTIVIIFYAVFPLLDKDSDKNLPFSGWYPIDVKKYRLPIYLFQILCLTVSAFTNANLDIFTAYLISIGIAHLKLLKKSLRNIDYTCADGISKINANNLGEIVFLYDHCMLYVALIENMFSYGIFIQFLASIAVICFTGFQMLVVSPASAQFVLLLTYISCMMCQVTMYCGFGNEILFESNGIAEACYMSNWYEGTPKSKKVIYLIMERSKRNIKLTAGKFFVLSLSTLVMIMKSSYSYFAVLQRVYKDKEITK